MHAGSPSKPNVMSNAELSQEILQTRQRLNDLSVSDTVGRRELFEYTINQGSELFFMQEPN